MDEVPFIVLVFVGGWIANNLVWAYVVYRLLLKKEG